MLTSSRQQLTRIATLRNCAGIVALSFLCISWNAFNAQFAADSLTKTTTNSNHQASAETSFDFTRPPFDRAAKHLHEKFQQFKTHWATDSKPNARQSNAEPQSSQAYARAENGAQQSVAHDQNQFDPSHFLSHTSRNALKFACESAQDVWLMLNPSIHSFAHPNEYSDVDSESVDEALEHIRGIMHILSQTHNALLEKKFENLPVFRKLWLKYLYVYKDPHFAGNRGGQSTKFRKALSKFARSAADFDRIFRNGDTIKQNAKAAMRILAKEMRQSVSSLKQSVKKATHRGWLMASDVHLHVEEITKSVKDLGEKWLHKMPSLAEATRPISDNLPSPERRQQLLKEFEDMMTELKEEAWRSRTELMYQRGEALSWAEHKIHDLKRRAALESDRAFHSLNIYAHIAKQILYETFKRCQESLLILRVRLSGLMERLIVIRGLWSNAMKSFRGKCRRLLVLHILNYWRVFAFIAVVIVFRFLLGFLLADEYFRTVLTHTISQPDMNDSGNQGPGTAAHRHPETLPSGSPSKSETSESRPGRKSPTPERQGPTNLPKPSRLRGSTPPEQNRRIKTRVQRRERQTVSKAGNDRTQKQTTPLQVSNLHHQNTLTSLEGQMNGRPIHLGDHEVQLVYEDSPRDDATDTPGNGEGRQRISVPAKTIGPQRTSRRGEKKLASNQETENSDDVIVVNSSDEMSTSYGSASSRLTRASLRRASARRSQVR